ncbi:TM2 domain-containing protein [Myceligenerans salitolerans]|uniref:TM2 domain-containing protein n=1 Tax=Myceligenerans salitolerans TaxID=1230528 RepID=A0ABS3I953_9MICO|nr:TM2 domain-containing protein [Myceligenerans salitolerans]MBO0609561.1 TM2 domain-containing protein [Myceligenerans salitolerans]
MNRHHPNDEPTEAIDYDKTVQVPGGRPLDETIPLPDGTRVESGYTRPLHFPGSTPRPPSPPTSKVKGKSRVVAGLLGIFLGALGAHRFYLGYRALGLVMLAITVIGAIAGFGFISAIWGLIEGVLYLALRRGYWSVDAKQRPLRD